jgi:signal transduction histidine kinase
VPRPDQRGKTEQIAELLQTDVEAGIRDRPGFVAQVSALARQRRAEGTRPQELVREFDALSRLLAQACTEWLESCPDAPPADEVSRVAGLVARAPMEMAQIAIAAYRDEEFRGSARAAGAMKLLVDNLRHETSTPLNAAMVAASVLDDDMIAAIPEERRRFVGLLQRALERARDVLDELRTGEAPGPSQPHEDRFVATGRVLASVLAATHEVAERAGVRIEVSEPIPDIDVDAVCTELILLNLIGNAIKYVYRDRPVRWVRIRFHRDGGNWWAEVSDNGLGIPRLPGPSSGGRRRHLPATGTGKVRAIPCTRKKRGRKRTG